MSPTPMIEVQVARIGRPHGIRGELTVEPRTDEPDRRFVPGARLCAESDGTEFVVEGARWHSGRLLLRLEGVDDRNAAEALRGTILTAEVAEEEAPSDPDEFWDRDLVGLQVRDAAGEPVGAVRQVLHGPQDLLEVRLDDGALRLVPFVAALVPVVDLDQQYCQLADVDGLLHDLDDEPNR